MKHCKHPGCAKPLHAAGYCCAHYTRVYRNEPLDAPIRNKAKAGEPLRWLEAHVGHTGDDCLTWPFSRVRDGRGVMQHKGKLCAASRVMCTFAHGNPPTIEYEAAHSCHNGHLACVNPRHLYWATRKDNIHESREAASRVEDRNVVDFILAHPEMSTTELSVATGYSRMHVSIIRSGKSWV